MSESLAFLPFLAPLALVLAAAFAHRQGVAPRRAQAVVEAAGVLALAVAVLTLATLIALGAATSPLVGAAGIGFSVRIDALSVTMLALVAFVGLVVVRFSRNYLSGDPRQAAFAGGLALTLGAVMLLVTAGNLVQLLAAWIATSLALHRLLVFYPERPKAILAAHKKFVAARLGDVALAFALVLVALRFGTTDIASIAAAAKALSPAEAGAGLGAAAALLALAAMLKSAQFPLHGWLPEVVETPTPVSALLHAGIINAGGFLVLRFADVMLLSPGALHGLALVGGFTALFASAVMLTQPGIKVQLAWSTIAQMGFMLFQCGIGAFAIALLHIVAHSLYKAHAFLASGSAVSLLKGGAPATGGLATSRGIIAAVVALAAAGFAILMVPIGVDAVALTLGSIFGLGLLLFAEPLAATKRPMAAVLLAIAGGAGATLAYALLHDAAIHLLAGTLPAGLPLDAIGSVILVLAVASFAGLAALQLAAPLWTTTPAGRAARIHLASGLYVNAVIDRWLAPSLAMAAKRPRPAHS